MRNIIIIPLLLIFIFSCCSKKQIVENNHLKYNKTQIELKIKADLDKTDPIYRETMKSIKDRKIWNVTLLDFKDRNSKTRFNSYEELANLDWYVLPHYSVKPNNIENGSVFNLFVHNPDIVTLYGLKNGKVLIMYRAKRINGKIAITSVADESMFYEDNRFNYHLKNAKGAQLFTLNFDWKTYYFGYIDENGKLFAEFIGAISKNNYRLKSKGIKVKEQTIRLNEDQIKKGIIEFNVSY